MQNEEPQPATGPGVDGRGPLRSGDTVILLDDRNRRYMVRLQSGKIFHTTLGTLPHDALIGQDEGCRVNTHKGRPLICVRPTLEQFVLEIPRRTQIIYPKDLGEILVRGQIFPGARVFQAGIGSGALSVALLRFLGPTGRLYSYEARSEFAALAQDNIRRFLGFEPENHQVEIRDVYAGIDVTDLDTLMLDVPDPSPCAAAAAAALRPGGVLMVWLPTVLQVHQLVGALRHEGHFDLIDTTETIKRPWYVTAISMRPEHRMVAHTGFLITARRCAPRPAPAPGAGGDGDAHADAEGFLDDANEVPSPAVDEVGNNAGEEHV